MSTGYTCGLCGMGHRDDSAMFGSRWSAYYRAIYCMEWDADDPQLSGLAYYKREDRTDYLPPAAHQRFDDAHLDPLSLVAFQGASPLLDMWSPGTETGTMGYGFRFHDSCWRLMEQACAPLPVDLKMLWRILYSVPHSSHLPFWGHNFGGLYLSNGGYHTGSPFLVPSVASSLMIPSTYYDPFTVPELRTRLAQIRIQTDGATANTGEMKIIKPWNPAQHTFDPFSMLPIELREMMLAYVATEDTLSFRLSSRVIATVPLSQYFFQSRFWPGYELDVFFDGFLIGPSDRAGIDWRELYRVSKQRIKYNSVGLGERNRLRIWKQTVRPLARAFVDIARLSELKGKSRWLRDPENASGVTWKAVEATWYSTPESIGEINRRIFEAEIELPSSKIEAIHVSLVEFFGTKFISGLAFETEDGEDIEIGYIIPGAEEPLIVEGNLGGFHIAVDNCGFRAISPYTSQHMLSEHLDWVGDGAGLPVQTLKCGGGTVRRIRATLDGFRIQALYIPESNGGR